MSSRRAASERPTRTAPADLESAVAALGVEIRGGDEVELKGVCPKHLERTGSADRHPSWSVNRSTGLHGCFSCGYSGTFLSLVMDLRFPKDAWGASRWIRQWGVDLQKAVDSLKLWGPAEEPEEELDINLGGRYAMFVDPPSSALRARGVTLEACQAYGVRWDPRDEAWILPIRLPDGMLIGWQVKSQGGRLFRNFPVGVPKARCLFGLEIFPADAPALVVESPLDAVRVYSAGFAGAMSTFGSGWSRRQLRLLPERTDELILAFDDDKEGRIARNRVLYGDAKRRIPAFTRTMPETYVFDYADTGCKDPGDMTDAQVASGIAGRVHWLRLVRDSVASLQWKQARA